MTRVWCSMGFDAFDLLLVIANAIGATKIYQIEELQ